MSEDFDNEDDWDWKEENDDEDEGQYDYPEEEDIYVQQEYDIQAVYRDIERAGMIQDEDLEIPIGEDVKMDPDLKFKLDLQTLLEENKLGLSKADISNIKKIVKHLPFIQYKNALLLVLGYYFFMYISGKSEEQKEKEFKLMDEYIRSETFFTRYEIIRYGRYWQSQLQNKIDFIKH